MSGKRKKALRRVARDLLASPTAPRATSSYLVLRNKMRNVVEPPPEGSPEGTAPMVKRKAFPGTLLVNPETERGIYLGLKKLDKAGKLSKGKVKRPADR